MSKPITSLEKIKKIKLLRERGMSIKEIAKSTKSSVATISKYTKGVKITKEGQDRLLKRRFPTKTISEETWNETLLIANKLIGKLSNRDKFLIAISLYWGEGTKKELNLINGDPNMIKFFLNAILRLGIKKDDIKINIRYYSNQDQESITKFWLSFLNLNKDNLTGYEKVASNGINKLEYGMCRLRVSKSSYYHKLIVNSINLIKNSW